MVQFIDEPPSPMSQFAQSFGQGLNQGLNGMLKASQQKANSEKELKQVRGVLRGIFKDSDPYERLNRESRDDMTKLAQEFTKMGINSDEASQTAFDLISGALKQKKTQAKAQRQQQASVEDEIKAASEPGFYEKNLAFRPNRQPLSKLFGFDPQAPVNTAAGLGRTVPMTADFLANLYTGARQTGEFAGEGLPEEQKELLKSSRKTGPLSVFPVPDFPHPEFTEQYDINTGGRGVPSGPGGRVGQATAAGAMVGGPPGAAVGALMSSVSELGEQLGLPSWATELLSFVAPIAGAKGVSVAGSRTAAKSVIKEAESVSQKTGKPIGEVLSEAAQKGKIDTSKVAAGDVKEVSKLKNAVSKTVPDVAERVKQTPKTVFHEKAAIKERESFGKNLKERPLEEYFKPEKETKSEAATLAKKAENEARLRPLEKEKFSEIQRLQDEIRKLQGARQRGGSAIENGRLNANIDVTRNRLQQRIEELRDVQYELKHNRPRASEAEIDTAIKKSVEEFKREAANPTEKGQKEILNQLELDKKYLERAQRVLNAGEIPGDVRPDTFLKLKNKYIEGYEAAIKSLREQVESLRGEKDAASIKQMQDSRKTIDYLKDRLPRLKADLRNQTDKLKTIKGLSGAQGAFFKQQLKTLRPDVSAFQKDFFRAMEEKTSKKTRVETAFKKGAEEVKKFTETVKKAQEKPTPENVDKVVKQAEIPKEKFDKAQKETQEILKKAKETGKISQADIDKVNAQWKEIGDEASTNVSKKPGLKKVIPWIKRLFRYGPMFSLGIYFLTDGEQTTFGQFLKKRTENKEIDAFAAALASDDDEKIDRMVTEFISKGYSQSKIRTMGKAARARLELREEDKK